MDKDIIEQDPFSVDNTNYEERESEKSLSLRLEEAFNNRDLECVKYLRTQGAVLDPEQTKKVGDTLTSWMLKCLSGYGMGKKDRIENIWDFLFNLCQYESSIFRKIEWILPHAIKSIGLSNLHDLVHLCREKKIQFDLSHHQTCCLISNVALNLLYGNSGELAVLAMSSSMKHGRWQVLAEDIKYVIQTSILTCDFPKLPWRHLNDLSNLDLAHSVEFLLLFYLFLSIDGQPSLIPDDTGTYSCDMQVCYSMMKDALRMLKDRSKIQRNHPSLNQDTVENLISIGERCYLRTTTVLTLNGYLKPDPRFMWRPSDCVLLDKTTRACYLAVLCLRSLPKNVWFSLPIEMVFEILSHCVGDFRVCQLPQSSLDLW